MALPLWQPLSDNVLEPNHRSGLPSTVRYDVGQKEFTQRARTTQSREWRQVRPVGSSRSHRRFGVNEATGGGGTGQSREKEWGEFPGDLMEDRKAAVLIGA